LVFLINIMKLLPEIEWLEQVKQRSNILTVDSTRLNVGSGIVFRLGSISFLATSNKARFIAGLLKVVETIKFDFVIGPLISIHNHC